MSGLSRMSRLGAHWLLLLAIPAAAAAAASGGEQPAACAAVAAAAAAAIAPGRAEELQAALEAGDECHEGPSCGLHALQLRSSSSSKPATLTASSSETHSSSSSEAAAASTTLQSAADLTATVPPAAAGAAAAGGAAAGDAAGAAAGGTARVQSNETRAARLEAGMHAICSVSNPDMCIWADVHTRGTSVQIGKGYGPVFWIDGSRSRLVPAYFKDPVGGPTMCLDVKDHRAQPGTPVQTWDCMESNADQLFDLPNGVGRIVWASHPNLCLDVRDHKFVSGAPLQVWTCQDWNQDQLWKLVGPLEP